MPHVTPFTTIDRRAHLFGDIRRTVFTQHLGKVPKMEESENLHKLYGYGLWIREFPHPQNSRTSGSFGNPNHFRYRTKFLVNCGFKDPGKLWNSKQDRTIGEACAAWIKKAASGSFSIWAPTCFIGGITPGTQL